MLAAGSLQDGNKINPRALAANNASWRARLHPFTIRARLTCMSQTEGPESQIGGGVGDAAQAVLDGVDGLMHRHIGEVKLWDRKGTSK